MTSPRTISRLSRILALIPYVIERGSADVEEIQQRFGYTKDQLARDLETVFVCGLPGYGPGDLMEAYIDEDEVVIDAADYFARAPRMTSAEGLALLTAALAVSGAGEESQHLLSAISKLTSVLLPDAEGAISINVSAGSELIPQLRKAASEKKPVRIRYRSFSKEEETTRVVEPWLIVATLGNWYLKGFCRKVNDERVFRIDRIRDIEVLEDTFEAPPVAEAVIGYAPGDDHIRTVIDLRPAARWVLDYYPVEVLEDSEKTVRIAFSAADPEIPARLLLRLGQHAALVSGDETRDRLNTLASSILETYR